VTEVHRHQADSRTTCCQQSAVGHGRGSKAELCAAGTTPSLAEKAGGKAASTEQLQCS